MSLLVNKDNYQNYIGADLGVSDWVEITQENVNKFADVTLDHQFIHVDPEKAKHTPFGGTIGHGFLSLSMLSYFAASGCGVWIEGAKMGINYGMDKVRFISPVRVGKRIRGKSVLLEATEKNDGQFLFKQQLTVEIEGENNPAVIVEWLTMAIM